MKRLPVLSLLPSLAAPLAEADWNAAFEARDAAGREAITRYKAAEMMESLSAEQRAALQEELESQ